MDEGLDGVDDPTAVVMEFSGPECTEDDTTFDMLILVMEYGDEQSSNKLHPFSHHSLH